MTTSFDSGAPLATTQDVINRWRAMSDTEMGVAYSLLEEAAAILTVAAPGVRERAAASPDAAVAARSVVVSMALRVLKNPDAIRQFSSDEASFTRDNAASSGALYATPEELALLSTGSSATATAHQAYTISLGGP